MGDCHTILLADADPHVQAAVKRVAEKLGHQLVQTTSGRDVVELAIEHRPDVVVIDFVLQDVDGRDMLAKLKGGERTCDIPVLVWSGRSDEDTRRVALALGAEDYVEKFDAQTLLRKVERVLLNSCGPQRAVSSTHLIAVDPVALDERGSTNKRAG